MAVSRAGNEKTDAVTERFRRFAVIPVITIRNPEHAEPLAQALVSGGLPCAEITFRTPSAQEALRRMAAAQPSMLLGAGTVLTPGQASEAKEAGAHFAVSPGLNPRVVDHCQELGLPMYPGVCTPTEVEAALERELNVLKFFPAGPLGGPRYLAALSAPFPGLGFLPTGGVTLDQLADYLALDCVVACGGSWIAPTDWIDAGAFDRIQEAARNAVRAAEHLAEHP